MSLSKPIVPDDCKILGVSGHPTLYSSYWGVLFGLEVDSSKFSGSKCSLCLSTKNLEMSKGKPWVAELPTMIRYQGFCYTFHIPVVYCEKCSNILTEKWYENPERTDFYGKDCFMGEGEDYWQILDSIRRRFAIYPYPLLIPTITALERLGLDSDLVREMFSELSNVVSSGT